MTASDRFTKKMIVVGVRLLSQQLGGVWPTPEQADAADFLPPSEEIISLFGTWEALLRASRKAAKTNLPLPNPRKAELLEEMLAYVRNTHKMPDRKEMNASPELRNFNTYDYHFGCVSIVLRCVIRALRQRGEANLADEVEQEYELRQKQHHRNNRGG
jgi:hypothetical protein